MNETLQYPIGVDFRSPRPRSGVGGALLGAIFGYAVTRSSNGAIAGGAVGGLVGNQPMPLNEALRQRFSEKSLDVVSFYRLGRFGAKILFRLNDAYWTLESHAPQTPVMNIEQIEDWLYGDITQKLEIFLGQNDLRLAP